MKAIARLLRAAALALPALGFLAAPASALSYGGWSARLGLDSWYDDNLARGAAVAPGALARGNQDLGGRLSLSVGNVLVWTPEVETWVLANASGSMGYLYPELAFAWGSLYQQTLWHLGEGRDLFWLAGATTYGGPGTYLATELGYVQALWEGAAARFEAGGGYFGAAADTDSFALPSVGVGLDQGFPTGTLLGARYALQAQGYADHTQPRQQASLMALQRLGEQWELHAQLLITGVSGQGSPYTESYFNVGVGFGL